ncbi:MAG: endo-beta-N-acetylglucosaminidase [Gammaproteobacteria bacterium]
MKNNKISCLLISLIAMLIGHLAYAEPQNKCLANNYTADVRPSLTSIANAEDFYNWRTFLNFSKASVANIPLAARAPIVGPSSLVGFDIDDRAWQYDFLSTQWSQGGCGFYKKTTEERTANNVYNFKFWQYVDISYYFGHKLVTIPPTMWTNAAHKNGVLSLGTFNLNEINPFTVIDAQHVHKTSATLVEIAKTLGFDGYLINYEKAQFWFYQPLLILMRELQQQGLTVIWYDAPLSGGFANYFNQSAVPFFSAAGYFQTNYSWGYPYKEGLPALSYTTLLNNHLDKLNNHVFQMGDSYRDSFKADPFQTCPVETENKFFSRFKEVYTDATQSSYYTGLGFYAPNWTMFGGKPDPETDTNVPSATAFEQSDAGYWEGSGLYGCGTYDSRHVSFYVKPRTVITHLPFYTNFNTGVGERYFLSGKLASAGAWSHFTLQSILPTWQNLKSFDSPKTVRAYFDYQTAYEGGASWKMEGNHIAPGHNIIFKGFKTDFKTENHDEVHLVVKTTMNETIQLVVNQFNHLASVQKINLDDGWQKLIFKLPANLLVTELNIEVTPGESGIFNVNIGSLKVFHPTSSPVPQNQLATRSESLLTWMAKSPGSLYRIYGKKSDGTHVLLNEVANTFYDLHGNIFNGTVDFMRFTSFVIQEVTVAGDYVPVSF